MAANAVDMGTDQMSTQTENLTCHSHSTSEQMHKLDPGVGHSELWRESECLKNEHKVVDNPVASSSVDEESHQVSNISVNSITQQLGPPQYDLGEISEAGEGLCHQQSILEQISDSLSNDKSEKECQPASQNVQNEPLENTDAVASSLVKGQMESAKQCHPASENVQDEPVENTGGVASFHVKGEMESVKECQPASENVQNEPVQDTGAVDSFLDKGQMESLEDCQPASQNVQNEPVEDTDAVASFQMELIKECQPASQNVQNEPLESTDAVTSFLVKGQMESTKQCQSASQTVQNEPVQNTVALASFLVKGQMESSVKECQPASENVQNEPVEGTDAVASFLVEGQMESLKDCQPASHNVQNEPVEDTDTVASFAAKGQMESITSQVNMNSGNEQLEPPSGDVGKSTGAECLETKPKWATHIQLRCKNKRNSKLLKKKYTLRSSVNNDRVLRSRTQEKPKAPEQNSNLVHVNNAEGNKRKGRKKKRRTGQEVVDEYSRIRTHLRYLLNRVKYEQSLIDAYSGEGWKGYSMEKLKPEKELQRARSEILRRKLKIRDLFRRLDTLCAEGRLPESLFDSEGEIDSEDIFCAKCGSKDMTTHNDIILCDGACDRGFHQFCLQPPLLTENSNHQGDEGWLCPGCDCKDDCLDILNDSLGTNLTISDNWEKVFPETENNLDQNSGLPSDDSGDDDYNPDVPEGEGEGGESSSDESDYDSASEKLEASNNDEQYLSPPSDDSEDDDFDPNALDVDRKVAEESSSSDFTSASEDLGATIADSTMDGQVDDPESVSDSRQYKGSGRKNCKVGKKKPSLADKLSLLDGDLRQEVSKPISGRRHVERLDYKKLYDEEYHNVPSSSSDDEDYTDDAAPDRRNKFTGKLTPVSPNGKASMPAHIQRETAHTPEKNICRRKAKSANNSPLVKSNSSGRKRGSSTYRKLGESTVQRLFESFKENQYPDRATKESLAQEIGITFQQVSKWFENNRWSFRHSSRMEASTGANALEQATCSKAGNGESHGGSGQKSTTARSRKRKYKSDPQGSDGNHCIDGAATKYPAGSPLTREAQTGRKLKARRRK